MSDAAPRIDRPEQHDAGEPARPARRGIFKDPTVRRMAYVAAAMVALFILTIVSAFVTGVASSTGPRTRAEKEVAVASAAVLSGSKDAAVWGQYVVALISTRQYTVAKDAIRQARASIDDSTTAEFTLAEARLQSAQGDLKGAIATADKAMEQMNAAHQALLKGDNLTAKGAAIGGLPDNYYAATLLKAYAYRDMKSWKQAVEQFGVYLGANPDAADILIDRGLARIEAGDKKGAEKDFRAALKFVPDDKEALAGLKRIGATR